MGTAIGDGISSNTSVIPGIWLLTCTEATRSTVVSVGKANTRFHSPFTNLSTPCSEVIIRVQCVCVYVCQHKCVHICMDTCLHMHEEARGWCLVSSSNFFLLIFQTRSLWTQRSSLCFYHCIISADQIASLNLLFLLLVSGITGMPPVFMWVLGLVLACRFFMGCHFHFGLHIYLFFWDILPCTPG